MKTRELRNPMAALAMVLALLGFVACASGSSGPQGPSGAGGGAVVAPGAAGAQPTVPGTPDNPPGAVEKPPSEAVPGTAMADTSGSADAMGQAVEAAKVDCSTVRCAACPEGQTPRLKPPDCCKCVPIDTSITDCSNVR